MADSGAKTVGSIEALLEEVRRDFRGWKTDTFPWFRGEKQSTKTPLLPTLFREPGRHAENVLLQRFRMKAPSLGLQVIPHRDHTDEWLFLARHVGLPTRLLDWTEGLLIALLFAVYDAHGEPRKKEDGATVWMLDPVALNGLSDPVPPPHSNAFPLPWINNPTELPLRGEVLAWLIASADDTIAAKAGYSNTGEYLTAIQASMLPNIGALNVRRAWSEPKGTTAGKDGTDFPVALYGTSIHPRITAQKGCFTIHGIREEPLSELVGARILRQYEVASDALDQIRSDLRMAGITQSTVFPDLDGLAMDLRAWF